MEVIEIDPNELEIDPLNERNDNVGPYKKDESLERSISQQGVIQPPVVRRQNGSYHVVVGQRRTLAAQSVGVDEIPVIVMDWDDSEAIEATITENVDAFRKSVSKTDRSKAIEKLMKINGWTAADIADSLGVSQTTVKNWTERTRDEWKETSVHVDSSTEDPDEETEIETHSPESTLNKKELDKIPDSDLATVRTATETSDEREEVVKTIVKEDLSGRKIREAKKRAENSDEPLEKTVKQVAEENNTQPEGGMKVETRVTFAGDYAKGLQSAAKDSGTSEEQIVRKAIREFLTEEGYL